MSKLNMNRQRRRKQIMTPKPYKNKKQLTQQLNPPLEKYLKKKSGNK